MADKKISQLTAASTPLAGTEVLPIVQSGSTVKVSVDNLTAGKMVQASSFNVGVTPANMVGKVSVSTSFSSGGSLTGLTYATTGSNVDQAILNPYYLASASAYNRCLDIACIGDPDGTSAGSIIRFLTNPVTNNAPAVEAMRIDDSQNVTVSIGNLKVGTAGKGIDFSANSHAAGMTSELLDDYEEGTFTPVITTTNADATVSSYTSQKGFYVKVGDLVFCSVQLRANISSAGTGDPQITGFPFAPMGDSNAGATIVYWDLLTTKAGYTAFSPFGAMAGGSSALTFSGAAWATGVNNYLYFTVVLRA